MRTNSLKKASYREDIDGLRAVAIIAVLLFHAFPMVFCGGFIGVDVFFVISGYLITGLILKELIRGDFSFSNFYMRRIVRLFPSLIAVLTASLVAGWYLLLPDEFSNLGKHIAAGIGFSSNLLLYIESGYFDSRSVYKPLLHLWSLGIEEQFYLLWPIILIFSSYRKFVLPALVTFFSLSFVINLGLISRSSEAAFFLPFTRFWELILGAFLVKFEDRGVATAKAHNFQSSIGIFFIFSSIYLIKNGEGFPGWIALFPCLGTCLVISAKESWLNKKILSHRYLVFVGLISYPLYLWHWPILSFGSIITGDDLSIFARCAIIAISFFLAIYSYYCLELPAKRLFIVRQRMVPLISSAILIAVGVCGLVAFKLESSLGRNTTFDFISNSKQEFRESVKGPTALGCKTQYLPVEICAIGDSLAQPTIAIIGDSHANHWFPVLDDYFKSKKENLLLLAKSGTTPFDKVTSLRKPPTSNADVIKLVLEKSSIHTVIIAGFWNAYFSEHGVTFPTYSYKNIIQDDTNVELKNQNIVFEAGLERTIRLFLKAGKKIIFIYDIPSLTFDLGRCVKRPLADFLVTNKMECVLSKNQAYSNQEDYREVVKSLLEKYPEVKIFDPFLSLCKGINCLVLHNEGLLYSDEHHLSISGSKFLRPAIDQVF